MEDHVLGMFLTVLDMFWDTVLTSFASKHTCTHLGTLLGPLFDTFLNTLLPSFASKVTTLFGHVLVLVCTCVFWTIKTMSFFGVKVLVAWTMFLNNAQETWVPLYNM